jgi:hypothetical protein
MLAIKDLNVPVACLKTLTYRRLDSISSKAKKWDMSLYRLQHLCNEMPEQ